MTPLSSTPVGTSVPRLLTYARTHDAETFAIEANLTTAEADQLRLTLDQLVEIGAVATYQLEAPLDRATNSDAVLQLLCRKLGSLDVKAAAGAAQYPSTPTPKPQMVVPVWCFEPDPGRPGVLIAYGLFSGVPMVFEALPVQDEELAQPLPSVAARFHAWCAATDCRTMTGTSAIPGAGGAYAIFAALQAA